MRRLTQKREKLGKEVVAAGKEFTEGVGDATGEKSEVGNMGSFENDNNMTD